MSVMQLLASIGSSSAAAIEIDDYYANVELLLHMDGVNSGTTFVDHSKNNSTVTPSNTTTISASPKFGISSASFNTTGGQITGVNTYLAVGSGDFTVEFWVYMPTIAGSATGCMVSTGASTGGYIISAGSTGLGGTDNRVNVWSPAGTMVGTSTISNSTWHHVAWTRTGTTARLYVDGIQEATQTDSHNYTATGYGIGSGYHTAEANTKIDEFRVTKGVGRYTSAFTTRTTAWPHAGATPTFVAAANANGASVNTVTYPTATRVGDFLLLCVNSAVTAAQTPPGWTKHGSTYTSPTLSYQYCFYTKISSGETTVTYQTATTNGGAKLVVYRGGGSIGALGTFSESANGATMTINGITPTSVNSVIVGYGSDRDPSGTLSAQEAGWTARETTTQTYFSETVTDKKYNSLSATGTQTWNAVNSSYAAVGALIEILPGGDPTVDYNFSSVVLLVVNDNKANTTTTFADQANTPVTMSVVGAAQYSTAQAPIGMTSSMLLDGTGDYISTPDSSDWDFGSGDWTVEGMVRWVAGGKYSTLVAQTDYQAGPDADFGWWCLLPNIGTDHNTYFEFTTNGSWAGTGIYDASAWTPSTGVWYHVAFCRAGNTQRVFVDGTQIGADFALSATIFNSSHLLAIGASGATNTYDHNGYMSNVRITKGLSRYNSNFTVPVLPLPIK